MGASGRRDLRSRPRPMRRYYSKRRQAIQPTSLRWSKCLSQLTIGFQLAKIWLTRGHSFRVFLVPIRRPRLSVCGTPEVSVVAQRRGLERTSRCRGTADGEACAASRSPLAGRFRIGPLRKSRRPQPSQPVQSVIFTRDVEKRSLRARRCRARLWSITSCPRMSEDGYSVRSPPT